MTAEQESLRETEFWLAQPGILDDVAAAHEELERGVTVSESEIRAQFGDRAR